MQNPSVLARCATLKSKLSLSRESLTKALAGRIAILKPLRERLRENPSIDQTREHYQIEVSGNAVFARHERMDLESPV
jgi:sensor domain CHASE-containing protein